MCVRPQAGEQERCTLFIFVAAQVVEIVYTRTVVPTIQSEAHATHNLHNLARLAYTFSDWRYTRYAPTKGKRCEP